MKIRAAEDSDISEITRIYARSVLEETASFELEPPDEAEMARRRMSLLDGGYPYLVATIEGQVVAFAYGSAYRPRPAYRGTVENTVYVAPTAQGKGVGKALISALIDECRARGFKQMLAVIGGAANDASTALHRACGFEQVGHLKNVGFKHERWLDSILMQRPL